MKFASIRSQAAWFIASSTAMGTLPVLGQVPTAHPAATTRTVPAVQVNFRSQRTEQELLRKQEDPVTGGQLETPSSGFGNGLTPIDLESVRAPLSTTNIMVDQVGTKVLPEDQTGVLGKTLVPLPNGEDRALGFRVYRWQATNICHFPLYFEEPMLERHGQQRLPTVIQPAVSGSKFLSNLILLPYKATLQPPLESRYTLGHFRPGSPAPVLRDTLPWSPRAAVVQGSAAAAVAVGLPW